MMDIDLEIEAAWVTLQRMNTVEDLLTFWALFGRTPYPHPGIEDVTPDTL